MKRSKIGLMLALPGYLLSISLITSDLANMTLPPTGTNRFLSIDYITTSTSSLLHTYSIILPSQLHYNPYALLIICFTLFSLHNLPISNILSLFLGAKQLVTLITHKTFSPNSYNFSFISLILLFTLCSISIFSITIGIRFALTIAFRQVF
jgi:hypothetical protein